MRMSANINSSNSANNTFGFLDFTTSVQIKQYSGTIFLCKRTVRCRN